jgi:hypothetical protein
MQETQAPFVRRPDGSWLCTNKVLLDAPLLKVWLGEGMVFRRGQHFLGVNVVATLEKMRRQADKR